MSEQSVAQQIHQFLGVPVSSSTKMAHGAKNASTTKRGTGRYHEAEHCKDSPHKSKGAPRGFVLHKASVGKRNRKALIAMAGGIRGFKKQQRANDAAEAA